MGERVIEGIEGISAGDGEAQRLGGCRLPDLEVGLLSLPLQKSATSMLPLTRRASSWRE
jgi:hypothetical protein